MIYFSDLDRTLIYSSKFISRSTNHICIEQIKDEEISYISENTIEKLKNILNSKRFVPTTTRSIEQYKRIKFSEHDINFEWSIVTNGGNILHNGEIYTPWKEIVRQQLKECEPLHIVMEYFDKYYSKIDGITKIRSVDDLFFYIVVDKEIYDESSLKQFEEYLNKNNWTLYVNGRKIYFIPSVVTKENAVKYLSSILNENSFYALGDSIMDFNMLECADKGFIPGNSTLANIEKTKNMFISKSEGFLGIEEILEEIFKN